MTLNRHLVETGQQADSTELILARQQALATTGTFANWTPKMVYNYHFGNREAFYTELFNQTRANHPFLTSTAFRPSRGPTAGPTTATTQASSSSRPKRAAAQQASAAWAGLSPQKRQRRQ